MRKALLGLVLLLFLVGCGGGSGTGGTKAPPPLVDPKIAFLGDSITQYGTYPDVVAAAVQGTAINAGFAGQGVVGILAQADTSVIALHPDLCVLFCGTNDAYFATPITEFQQNYETLLKKLLAAKIPVIIVTPPHFGAGSTFEGRDLNNSLIPVVNAIRAEATLHNLPVAEVNKATVSLNADGEHPDAAGQATIAQVILPVVQAELKKL